MGADKDRFSYKVFSWFIKRMILILIANHFMFHYQINVARDLEYEVERAQKTEK